MYLKLINWVFVLLISNMNYILYIKKWITIQKQRKVTNPLSLYFVHILKERIYNVLICYLYVKLILI
jgi:hypothetical protein